MGITCDRCTPSFSRSEFCQTVAQGFGDFTENAGVPESGWIDPDDGEGRHGHARAGFGRQRRPYRPWRKRCGRDHGRERTPVQGEVPNPLQPPTGCSFHPRCPLADARCRTERPVLQSVEGARVACHAVQEGRST